MSHPAQAKYGACKAVQKERKPCGMPIVRDGFCMYHQPEEMLARALAKLERNKKEYAAIVEEVRSATKAVLKK